VPNWLEINREILGFTRPAHEGIKEGYPLKSGYFSDICLSRVKMVADIGTDMVLIITNTGDMLLSNINIDGLE